MQFNLQFLTAWSDFSQWINKEADRHNCSWREEGKSSDSVSAVLFVSKQGESWSMKLIKQNIVMNKTVLIMFMKTLLYN